MFLYDTFLRRLAFAFKQWPKINELKVEHKSGCESVLCTCKQHGAEWLMVRSVVNHRPSLPWFTNLGLASMFCSPYLLQTTLVTELNILHQPRLNFLLLKSIRPSWPSSQSSLSNNASNNHVSKTRGTSE